MQKVPSAHKTADRGFLIALISAVILAFTSILIQILSKDYQLPALIIAFWRDLLVALCALPFILMFKPKLVAPPKRTLPFLVAFGAVLASFNILWTLAVTLTGASIATVLVYSSGAFTAILSWLILGESLGWQKIVAVIVCLLGSILVSGGTNPANWTQNTLGILTGLFSGVLYAIYSLLGRSAAQKGLNPWTTLMYTFLFAAVFLLGINLLPVKFIPGTATDPSELFSLGKRWEGWLLLLLLAAGPSLVGFGLYNISLSLLPSSTANLILTLEPVITALAAFFLLNERLTELELLGGGLILGALIILRLQQKNASMIKSDLHT